MAALADILCLAICLVQTVRVGLCFPSVLGSPPSNRPSRSTPPGDQVVDAVINSDPAVSETAAASAVSWWLVRAALTEAGLRTLPDVDELRPRMLGIEEHRFRSVRYFRDPDSPSWIRHEPWMTTIVALDTGQRGRTVSTTRASGTGSSPGRWSCVRARVSARSTPSAAFRKALGTRLAHTAGPRLQKHRELRIGLFSWEVPRGRRQNTYLGVHFPTTLKRHHLLCTQPLPETSFSGSP